MDNKKKNKHYTIYDLDTIIKEFKDMVRDAITIIIGKEDKHNQTKGE